MSAEPEIVIAPTNAMMDIPENITLHGFEPDKRVTITARPTNAAGVVWSANADYQIGDDGTDDLDEQTLISGTFTDADPMKAYQGTSRRYVLVSVPCEPLFRGMRMLRGDDWQDYGNHPEHVNHWNLLSVQNFSTNNGLAILRTALLPPFIWSIVLC